MTGTATLEREVGVHRYYDPAAGQFLSVDPVVDQTGTPYAFTGGDPVNNVDPSGLDFWGALADTFNPFSQNNALYRFGSHHPLAGRVVAGGAAVSAAAVGAIACVAGGCEAAAAAGAGLESRLSDLAGRCSEFFGDETGGLSLPARSQWGWTGSPSWNDAVRAADEAGTHVDILGKVPTQDEGEQLIEDAGGTIERIEGPHAPPNPHTYEHINYVTSLGQRATLRIQG